MSIYFFINLNNAIVSKVIKNGANKNIFFILNISTKINFKIAWFVNIKSSICLLYKKTNKLFG